MEKTYELMPNAKMLLSSLRSVGYTEETAIADIVDNSISSGANTIQLYFDWDDQTILIADNGKGTKFDNTIPRPEILLTEVWLGTRKK